MRVVLIVVDSLPHRYVSPTLTPHLWAQVVAGARAPEGGVAELVAATYPNHASFVTGLTSVEHRVLTNAALVDSGRFRPAEETGPGGETIFEGCIVRDRMSAAFLGDQKLVGVCGARRASIHWPPDGTLPDGTSTCALGYALDDEVVARVADADLAEASYVLIQLNEPDTASHLYGPDSPEALDQYRRTDAAYGRLIEALAHGWDDTICFTVSDHEQETLDPDQPPVDLHGAVRAHGLDLGVWMEGTGAVLIGDVGPHVPILRAVDGVEALVPLGDVDPAHGDDHAPPVEKWVAWTDPGRWFSKHAYPLLGGHGSPRTRTQVSVMSGGHAGMGTLARTLERQRPPAPIYGRWAMQLVEVD